MLYALGDPLSLLVLVLGFVVAVTLLGWLTGLVARRTGHRETALSERRRPTPQSQVDPIGAVAAAIGGAGWPRPFEQPHTRRTGAVLVTTLLGPLVLVAIGAALLVGVRVASGLSGLPVSFELLQSGAGGLDVTSKVMLLLSMSFVFTGLLALVPLPPLLAGRALFALAPQSPGWRKAEHYLVGQNFGTLAVLLLLLLPLGGEQPLLPTLLDLIARALLDPLRG